MKEVATHWFWAAIGTLIYSQLIRREDEVDWMRTVVISTLAAIGFTLIERHKRRKAAAAAEKP